MPRGGKRPGAGRKKGSRDIARAEEVAVLAVGARKHSGDALIALHKVALRGKSEAARVSAAIALLDRGYGRPMQTVDATVKGKIDLSGVPTDVLEQIRAAFGLVAGGSSDADDAGGRGE